MDWRRRSGSSSAADREQHGAEDGVGGPTERSAPGAAALLDGVSQDGSHSVLDLGPAADSSLRVYSRFASRVRFADLLPARARDGLVSALDAVPPQPGRPYDLIFAWNVPDRLSPAERTRLMERLAEVSAPNARLHLVVRAEEGARNGALRFALLDVDRMRCEPVRSDRPARGRLLPSQVEELLAPFRVSRGFTLRGGLREYVAVREEDGAADEPDGKPTV